MASRPRAHRRYPWTRLQKRQRQPRRRENSASLEGHARLRHHRRCDRVLAPAPVKVLRGTRFRIRDRIVDSGEEWPLTGCAAHAAAETRKVRDVCA